jgi:hypothetical protein
MRRSLLLLLLMVTAADANACGVCVIAATDLILPPIQLWMLIALTWFLSNGIIRSVTRIDLPLQPKAFGAVGVVFLCLIVGGIALGSLTVLPLMLPPAYAFVRSIVQRRAGERSVQVIGALHVLAIAMAVVFSVHTLRTRTDAEYIAQWPGSPTGRARFKALSSGGAASLPAYRVLLAGDNEFLALEAADRLGEIGIPEVDEPLLMNAAKRFRDSTDDYQRIQDALEKLRVRSGPSGRLDRAGT